MTYQLPEPKETGYSVDGVEILAYRADQMLDAYEQGRKSVVYTDNSAVIAKMETMYNDLTIDYADLKGQVAALEGDARRYRWLRSTTNFVTSKGRRIEVRDDPELWDESIDAAIAAEEA
jgi:hypothetical protein